MRANSRRAHFTMPLTEYSPGRPSILLIYRGEEVENECNLGTCRGETIRGCPTKGLCFLT